MSELEDKMKQQAGSALGKGEQEVNQTAGVDQGAQKSQGDADTGGSPQDPQAPTTPGAS